MEVRLLVCSPSSDKTTPHLRGIASSRARRELTLNGRKAHVRGLGGGNESLSTGP